MEEMGIKFTAMGQEFLIHNTIVNSYLIVIGIVIFAFIANKKIVETDPLEKPKGLVNILEIGYTGLRKQLYDVMGTGPTRERLVPYIFSLVMFIAPANLIGLLGLAPPTSDYNVTLALALITFFMTQYYGLKTNGLGGYIKGYFEPMPFLVPLNIVGELSNPISLSFRLFGNILSGGIIMGLVYGALGYLAPLAAPLHLYFDLFSGLVQTFIFMMLTMVFVGGNLPDEEGI